MADIKLEELVENLTQKFNNLLEQGNEAGKQHKDISELRIRIEGGKEVLARLIEEFKPQEESEVKPQEESEVGD
jgi:hypothetical protein